MTSLRKVISEEDYTEKLEEIIEHNYFPHLSVLQSQLEYLQENELYSIETLRSTYQKLFPQSLCGAISSESGDKLQTLKPAETQMTISQFFDTYISEDNYSFIKLQEKSLQEFRRKYHWMYEPSQIVPQLNDAIEDAKLLEENRRKLLGDLRSASLGIGYSSPSEKKTNMTQQPGMLMLYYLGDKVLTPQERQRMDACLAIRDAEDSAVTDSRSNNFSAAPFTVRNALMFPPELSSTSKGVTSQKLLTHSDPSASAAAFPAPPPRKKAKVVQTPVVSDPGRAFADRVDTFLRLPAHHPNNTALLTPLEAPHTPSTVLTAPSPAPHAFQRLEDLRNATTEDEEVKVLTQHSTVGSSQAQYEHVRMTPSPEPGAGLLASPLMTWGTLAGPPILISGPVDADAAVPTPPPPAVHSRDFAFRLPAPDPRERVARRLCDEKLKRKPHQKQIDSLEDQVSVVGTQSVYSAATLATARTAPQKKKLEELTPAAQALAKRMLGRQAMKM